MNTAGVENLESARPVQAATDGMQIRRRVELVEALIKTESFKRTTFGRPPYDERFLRQALKEALAANGFLLALESELAGNVRTVTEVTKATPNYFSLNVDGSTELDFTIEEARNTVQLFDPALMQWITYDERKPDDTADRWKTLAGEIVAGDYAAIARRLAENTGVSMEEVVIGGDGKRRVYDHMTGHWVAYDDTPPGGLDYRLEERLTVEQITELIDGRIKERFDGIEARVDPMLTSLDAVRKELQEFFTRRNSLPVDVEDAIDAAVARAVNDRVDPALKALDPIRTELENVLRRERAAADLLGGDPLNATQQQREAAPYKDIPGRCYVCHHDTLLWDRLRHRVFCRRACSNNMTEEEYVTRVLNRWNVGATESDPDAPVLHSGE
jgi:hypothetical protein